MNPPQVKALFINKERGLSSKAVDSVTATTSGLSGEYHTGSNSRRQILIQSVEALIDLDLVPGELFENMVVDGLELTDLIEGDKFQVGGAMIEITVPCEPCSKINHIRPGLIGEISGRRGHFARILSSGQIAIGDLLQKL